MLSHVPANFSTVVVTCILHNHYERKLILLKFFSSGVFLFCVGWGVCVYCVVKRRYNFYGIKMFCLYIHISRGLQEPPPSHQYHIYAYHEKWEKCNETTWKVLLEQLLKLLAYVCKLNTMGHVHMKTFLYYEIC